MSGSGGGYTGGSSGGGIGGGGSGGSANGSCETLIIRTSMSSPKPAVLKNLKANDILLVELENDTGPVLLKTKDKELAGSVVSGQLIRLIQCLTAGYSYIAIIKSIEKGKVDIEVRPEAKQ